MFDIFNVFIVFLLVFNLIGSVIKVNIIVKLKSKILRFINIFLFFSKSFIKISGKVKFDFIFIIGIMVVLRVSYGYFW